MDHLAQGRSVRDLSLDQKLERTTSLTISVIVMILNIFEIILISRVKNQKKKHYEIVLLSLSVADLLYGVSNALISIIFLADRKLSSVLDITRTTYFYFVLTSILHLTFIGADRVAAVVKPIEHKFFMTRKKLYVILAFIWVASTVSAVSLYVTNDKTDVFSKYHISFRNTNLTINSTSEQHAVQLQSKFTNSSTTVNLAQKQLKKQSTKSENSPIGNNKSKYRNAVGKNSKAKKKRQRKHRKKRKSVIKEKKGNYNRFMQKLLSHFIIVADLLLFFLYSFIVVKIRQRKQCSQTKEQNEQISFICVLVAGVFITFSLPYAIKTLVTGRAGFWANILLVSNSALNSVVYFFGNHCNIDGENFEEERTRSIRSHGVMTSSVMIATTPFNQN